MRCELWDGGGGGVEDGVDGGGGGLFGEGDTLEGGGERWVCALGESVPEDVVGCVGGEAGLGIAGTINGIGESGLQSECDLVI